MNKKERLERSISWGNNASIGAAIFAGVVVFDYVINGRVDQINPNLTIVVILVSSLVAVAGQYLARKAHHYRFHRKHAA